MKKKVIPLIIVALAITAFWFRDRWLPQPPGQMNYLGYVEGETVLVGPPKAGRIVDRPAKKGGQVKAGDLLFRLDDAAARIEVTRAEAAIRVAEASRDDLLTGKRDAELDPIRAQRAQAAAALELARQDLARASRLSASGVAAEQQLDQAKAAVAQLEAQVAQFDATLKASSLAARPEAIAAADAAIEQAKAAAQSARQAVSDLSVTAPADAAVDDTYFDPGEWVGAGQPVVSLLSPDDLTIRFFVPEADLSHATPGTHVRFICDGCKGETRDATITRTAVEPEFTPPVIYSQGARAKLVFMVEARPAELTGLRPGLPIEVEPLQ